MEPTIGRIVHYQRHGSPNGQHKAEPSPAVITKVLEDKKCQLFVMNPNGLYFDTCEYSEEPKPGCWSWPPRSEKESVLLLNKHDMIGALKLQVGMYALKIQSLESRIENLRAALEKIKSPDLSGVDQMIIADMGFNHFAQHSAKMALAADDAVIKENK